MGLSSNFSLPWSEQLIYRYEERWDYDSSHGLCSNMDLPWNLNVIKKYSTQWDWNYLGINGGLWTKVFEPVATNDFVEEYLQNS
jgi:hypothetical protein